MTHLPSLAPLLLVAFVACSSSSGSGPVILGDGGSGSGSSGSGSSGSGSSGSGSGGSGSGSSGSGSGSSGSGSGSSGSGSGSSGSGSGSSGSSSGGGDDGGTSAENAWLVPMNAARSTVGESPMHWDPIAAAVAQAWANQCSFGHNPNAGSDYDGMGGSGGLGENVAAGEPTESVSAAVASWVAEGSSYDHATNTCAAGAVCGHYTQIVWATTTAAGCAQATCTTNSPFGSGQWQMSVCDFNPPGNYVGQSPY